MVIGNKLGNTNRKKYGWHRKVTTHFFYFSSLGCDAAAPLALTRWLILSLSDQHSGPFAPRRFLVLPLPANIHFRIKVSAHHFVTPSFLRSPPPPRCSPASFSYLGAFRRRAQRIFRMKLREPTKASLCRIQRRRNSA